MKGAHGAVVELVDTLFSGDSELAHVRSNRIGLTILDYEKYFRFEAMVELVDTLL